MRKLTPDKKLKRYVVTYTIQCFCHSKAQAERMADDAISQGPLVLRTARKVTR